jgi:DNA-binding response OmpR family regulator
MRILVVEDDKDLSSAIARRLSLEKYEIDQAYDGEEGLDYIHQCEYDVIIMDVMMPKIDGLSAVKQMRSENISTPVLMLTARSMVDDKVMGLDSGADDYLTKPFVVKELMARIRALTRRNNSILNTYSYKDIILDPNTYELKSKNVVKLTSKEFKLMEFLIKNQGIFVSTEKILSSVWEFDSDVDVSVIWVFISTLRKHLESAGSNLTIKASRGIGYRLEEK